MKLYILRNGHEIDPFGENLDDLPFAESSLGAERERIAHRLGLSIEDVHQDSRTSLQTPCVVLSENCFVSEKALTDFLKRAAGFKAISQLSLAQTPSTDYTRPVSSVFVDKLESSGLGAKANNAKGPEAEATHRVRVHCYYLPPEHEAEVFQGILDHFQDEAQPVVVPKREILIPLQLPLWGAEVDRTFNYPITSTVACHVDHWVNLLWLNQLAFAIRWNETVRAHPVWAIAKVLRAGSLKPEKILPRLNRFGRHCKVHPTAYVEGCILGDNVTIGAKATLRNCIVGDNVTVEDHANVLSSVLAKTFTSRQKPLSFGLWPIVVR